MSFTKDCFITVKGDKLFRVFRNDEKYSFSPILDPRPAIEALSPSTKLPDALGRTVSAAAASPFSSLASRSAAGASVSGMRITSVASITARECLLFDMQTVHSLHTTRKITSRLISPGQAEPNHGNPKVRCPLRPNARVPHLAPALRSGLDPI
jgi:hypothetical protein